MKVKALALALLIFCLPQVAFSQAQTFEEIEVSVRRYLMEDTNETSFYWPRAEVQSRINQYASILAFTSGATEAETTYNLVSGTTSYIIPSNFAAARAAVLQGVYASGVKSSDDLALERIWPDQIGKVEEDGPSGSQPLYYCVWDDSLTVWPTPESTEKVKLFYYCDVPEMSTLATDTTILIGGWADILPMAVAADCLLQGADDSRAMILYNWYTKFSDGMVALRSGQPAVDTKGPGK